MKKLHVGCGAFGNIYAGKILKAGLWAAGKEDVTMEALVAVAMHVDMHGKPVEISRADGTGVEYRITVEHILGEKRKNGM